MNAACLDIETYGAFMYLGDGTMAPSQKDGERKVMHPRRSRFWHSEVTETVPMVSMTSLPDLQGNPREWLSTMQPGPTHVYLSHRPGHLDLLLDRIRSLDVVLGFNLLYDVSYLRDRFPVLRDWRPLVIDASVLAYLEDESKLEMSLKDLGLAHGLFKYDRTLKHDRFRTPESREAIAYAAQDTYNTVLLAAHCVRSILMWYGPNTWKATEDCLRWYSDSFWAVLHMYEAGVAMDRGKAIAFMKDLEQEMAPCVEHALRYDIVLEGKGCKKTQSAFVDQLLQDFPSILEDEQLVRQETMGGVTFTNRTNLSVFGRNLPSDHPCQVLFRDVDRWTYLRNALWTKVHSRLMWAPSQQQYLNRNEVAIPANPLPRGNKPAELDTWRHDTSIAILTPTWYLCPGRLTEDDQKTLGQKQIRPSCGTPGLQTDPKELHDLLCSRYEGGLIRTYDASQIELRVAAVWSGEPSFLLEYQKSNPDLHTRRAIEMFGPDLLQQHIGPVTGDHQDPRTWRSNPAFNQFRQVGKTGNFWYVYRGGADKMHEQSFAMLGIDLGIELFRKLERERPGAVPYLWAWQESLIDQAQRQGYLEVPFVGASRTYWGNVREEHATTVVNQLVQSCAAATNLALQQHLARTLPPRIHMVLQVYDSIKFDCHPDEAPFLDELVAEAVAQNTFWSRLCELTGHHVPLVMEG